MEGVFLIRIFHCLAQTRSYIVTIMYLFVYHKLTKLALKACYIALFTDKGLSYGKDIIKEYQS